MTRGGPLRTLLGMTLLVVSACLCAWGAFQVSRGPSQCGDYGPACPPGLVSGLLGATLALFVLAPVGAALCLRRVQGAPQAAAGLCLTAAAAGVYVARFVALPVRDATVPTWIAAGVLGVLGVLFLLAAFRVPPHEPERVAVLRASGGSADSLPRPRPGASPASAGTRGRPVPPPGAREPIGQLHDLLAHGLATGELAHDGAAAASGGAGQVVRLLDLHRRGVIGDAELRAALGALRDAPGA